MRNVFRISLGMLLAVIAARPASAQNDPIGLDQVYQLFTKGQERAAARALSAVSVDFRKEMGRCHDEDIGGRMIKAEPTFDALARKLASGAVLSAGVLAKEFAGYDRLLAEHHQQLAAEGWAKPRFTTMEAVARDLSLSAQYLARAGRWEKQPLSGDAQKAVDDAIAVAKRLSADPANKPPETPSVIDALGPLVKQQGHNGSGRGTH